MTSQTFTEFKEQIDAKKMIQANVVKYTEMLCEALKLDYNERAIKHHKMSIAAGNEVGNYHANAIEELKNGVSDYDFFIEEGRKYLKIVMDARGSKSVHAFIDKKTGEVYKPASWKAPAKHVRFNLLSIPSREECLSKADWSGGYLYM